jgi:flagellar assembly factor FliW
MEILTRDYGIIEIEESSIIRFDEGVIGFEGFRDYALLGDPDAQTPFRCLQSIDDGDLAFILIDPFSVKPDYEFKIDDDVAEQLSIGGGDNILILAIVVLPDDVKKMSCNLKAPIIINTAAQRGAQHIVDRGDYGVRHYVFDEIERAKKLGLFDSQAAV